MAREEATGTRWKDVRRDARVSTLLSAVVGAIAFVLVQGGTTAWPVPTRATVAAVAAPTTFLAATLLIVLPQVVGSRQRGFP